MKKQLLIITACAGTLTMLQAAPTVAALGVKNSASYADPGFPNGSIAQGSLFVVFGSAMGPSPIQYASSFPLPSNLMGTSINVTVNGTTLPCPMIYTSAGQLAAILPSTTPLGTGGLTVSYNGTSNAAPITVVKSSPGIFTVNEQGTGPGVIQDANGHQNALNFAFNPGQTVVVWGTGLGPITGSDASTPPSGNLPGVSVTANVGGQNAAVQYSGRSGDAGVDQINITLPAGVTGCYVPVYIVATPTGGTAVTSNFVTVSIAGSGSTCTDPNFPNISNGNGYKSGSVSLTRSIGNISLAGINAMTTTDTGAGGFQAYDPTYLANAGSFSFTDITVGSCTVIQLNSSNPVTPTLPKVLDAGPVINVNGPGGAKTMPQGKQGFYSPPQPFGMQSNLNIPILPNTPLYFTPGTYTVDNGNGGADVGPFKMTITVPPTFTWTNQAQITSVDRTKPLQLTWTGGDSNSEVVAVGSSSTANQGTVTFECIAKDSDLQLTVPTAILSLLPPSATLNGSASGSLTLGTANIVQGSAPGLDYLFGTFGYGYASVGIAYK